MESGEELFNGTREQGEMCNSYCWGVEVLGLLERLGLVAAMGCSNGPVIIRE